MPSDKEDDLVVTWTGPMEMRPTGPDDLKLVNGRDRALEVLRAHPSSAGACRIGKVSDQRTPKVLLKSAIGTQRILDMSTGEQLPRIC